MSTEKDQQLKIYIDNAGLLKTIGNDPNRNNKLNGQLKLVFFFISHKLLK